MDPFLQQRHYWHDADEAPFVPGSIAGESGGVRHDLDQERRRVERINRLIQDISTKMGQGGDGHASVGRNKVCHYLDGKNEKLTLEQPIQGLDRKLGSRRVESSGRSTVEQTKIGHGFYEMKENKSPEQLIEELDKEMAMSSPEYHLQH